MRPSKAILFHSAFNQNIFADFYADVFTGYMQLALRSTDRKSRYLADKWICPGAVVLLRHSCAHMIIHIYLIIHPSRLRHHIPDALYIHVSTQ